MDLVQVSVIRGTIKRVPNGETPVVELHLETHQRVIAMDLREVIPYSQRKTSDWVWKATVETRL